MQSIINYCKLIHINVTCIQLPQTIMYGIKHNGFNMYLYNMIVSDNKTDVPSAKLTKIVLENRKRYTWQIGEISSSREGET